MPVPIRSCASPSATVHYLMIFNGAVFLGVGYFLLKTAADPVRATLMWAANPVLIQQLVAGGQTRTTRRRSWSACS